MAEQITLVCDCGCGTKTLLGQKLLDVGECDDESGDGYWLKLSHYGSVAGEPIDSPRLAHDLVFSNFRCLARWANKAKVAAADLEDQAAAGPSPRGELLNERLGLVL